MRFDHYAKSQKWIWEKAAELRDRFDLGEAIDVIADALTIYEAQLKDREREARAEKTDPSD